MSLKVLNTNFSKDNTKALTWYETSYEIQGVEFVKKCFVITDYNADLKYSDLRNAEFKNLDELKKAL